MAADGLFFQAPFLNLYFATMGLLEGRPPQEILEKTKAAFHRAWGLSLLVWTPVQLLNLSLVPPTFQPAVVSAVNIGWKATLSLLNAKSGAGEEDVWERAKAAQRALDEMQVERSTLRAENQELRAGNHALQRRVAELSSELSTCHSMCQRLTELKGAQLHAHIPPRCCMADRSSSAGEEAAHANAARSSARS